VGLRAPAVVRLEGALAHVRLRLRVRMLQGDQRPVIQGSATAVKADTPSYQPTSGRLLSRSRVPARPSAARATLLTRPAALRPTKPSLMWTAVERLWTTLLACPVTVHTGTVEMMAVPGAPTEQPTGRSFVGAA
jgi:hypothetical protein